jgi:hypothetical protein
MKDKLQHIYTCTDTACFLLIALICRSDLGLQLSVQSVPVTTNVASSNPAHGEVYWIQHYVIKFVSDLQQFGGFLQVLQFPPPIKLVILILCVNFVISIFCVNFVISIFCVNFVISIFCVNFVISKFCVNFVNKLKTEYWDN